MPTRRTRKTAPKTSAAVAAPEAALRRRAAAIGRRLTRAYPDATCRLHFSSPFELLVATILAAQCTDDRVNLVTADLFPRARTPDAFARMSQATLERAVRSTGFFRNKARSIRAMSRMILDDFGGRVPREMDDLLRLPGVARKTANVVRGVAFGLPAIITDTHFIRLSRRLGLTRSDKPEQIERDLMALLPEAVWSAFSHAMLFHGRAVCDARKPACDRCPVQGLCPSAFQFPHFKKE